MTDGMARLRQLYPENARAQDKRDLREPLKAIDPKDDFARCWKGSDSEAEGSP